MSFGPNPVSIHYTENNIKLGTAVQTYGEALEWGLKHPKAMITAIVTPTASYDQEQVTRALEALKQQNAPTLEQQRQQAREAIDRARYERRLRAAEETVPGWGSFS